MRFSFAAGSVRGTKRSVNCDAAYASALILAVADGMEPGGDVAASTVIHTIADFAAQPSSSLRGGQLAERAAREAVKGAQRALVERAVPGRPLRTTLTLLVSSGDGLGMAHIGDTQEAVEPQFRARQWEPGDRCRLASDGLAFTIEAEEICYALRDHVDPATAVSALIEGPAVQGARTI